MERRQARQLLRQCRTELLRIGGRGVETHAPRGADRRCIGPALGAVSSGAVHAAALTGAALSRSNGNGGNPAAVIRLVCAGCAGGLDRADKTPACLLLSIDADEVSRAAGLAANAGGVALPPH